MQFPELETSRLILNKLSKVDGPALFEIFSDSNVVKYYDIDVYKTEEQSLDLIDFFNKRFDEKNGIRWAIRVKETGKLIGTCGLNSLNPKMKSAGIGYELAPHYWGLGFATEALQKVIELAFSTDAPFGELYRIQADTMIGNVASESVLEKLGFREEGIRRSSGYWKNEFHDLKCFGLLKPEFKDI
ncbi:GNAT family N-acetyltransferase [Pseudoalteromonas byunsanensis]|uniref:GNAT family N-acetyltransferase n=1 Tax=Pseudoalteromonas byunsanensis TaxID=327939 RepID=A0A1S1N692_9GAMM|nr:GNAT family protein [Pseudoalteromonas byunsanensis]OHU94941.1 GNAT family N-acetyltransferase [Pseudoalteromonas byunsanensis]